MFNENSKIVQDYVLLIRTRLKKIEDVPDFQNLREVVSYILSK